mgnify:CR=1 FL=1
MGARNMSHSLRVFSSCCTSHVDVIISRIVFISIASGCHGQTNLGLQQSMNDKATTDKVTNMEHDVVRLGTVEAMSDETMNLGS